MKNQPNELSYIQSEVSNNTASLFVKETYSAPQVKIHGKLERLTLEIGGSLGNTPEEEPSPLPL